MRPLAVSLLLLGFFGLCAGAQPREISFAQAQHIATIVAGHDNLQVDDRTVVLNSMDTRSQAGFIPGYYTFSVIQESDSAVSPDKTLRVYVISKRTADTWEMNLCTHYSFPELKKLQENVMRETGATPGDAGTMPQAIGCASQARAESPMPQ